MGAKRPRPMTGAGAASPSVGGVPDDREGVVVVLAGGTAEIGVEPARPELGSGEGQRHIVVARGFAAPVPGGADLAPVRPYSVVGLGSEQRRAGTEGGGRSKLWWWPC